MKKKSLGNTGLEVSEMAFGGVEIGLPYGIGVQSQEDMLSQKEAVSLLQTALEKGINFFDTARMYGESEKIMGIAFKEKRKDIVLATKCRHFRDRNGVMVSDDDLRDFIRNSLDESLRTLQTDYVDLFMLHQADMEILSNPIIEDTFQQLKKEGKIYATGASTYKVSETTCAIERGAWDVIQLPFNLMDQTQGVCFDKAAENEVGVVVRSVLLKGVLSDRGKNLHPELREVENHIRQFNALVQGNVPDLPTLATLFALSVPEVSSVLVGIDKLAYLENALKTVSYGYLSDELMDQARQLAYPDPSFLNLPHWDKMGWLT